ncbi:MAG: SLC13 family permease [Thermoanaerobaculia bacterium]|nr:SLC13 family permease [Thermoanaerobaculia bacterium]
MEIVLLVAVLLFALAAFTLEWMPVDQVALVALGLLILFGLISGEEAIQGFSNPAVITVLMMFILSEGLVQSGTVARLGHRIAHFAGHSPGRAWGLLLFFAAVVSGFLNNTAAVAILIPVALQLSKHYQISPSKVLLPLSYAAILGGTLTLIGTSTNLLVSALSADHGAGAISMFELTPLGIVFLAAGGLYVVLTAKGLLPARERPPGASLTRKYELGGFLTEMQIPESSRLVGRTVVSEQISTRFRLNVLEILRGRRKIAVDLRNTPLAPGDVLIVRGAPADLVSFRNHFGLLMLTDTKLQDSTLADAQNILAEIQIAPNSGLAGSSVEELGFRKRFGAFVLAINRTGEAIRDKVASIPIKPWDTLLVFGPRTRIEALHDHADFLPLTELDLHLTRPRRWWIPVAVVPLVVILAALGFLTILEASILGVVSLLLTRSLTLQRAYQAVDWSVIFMIAAMIPLGTAMENTGLATLLSDGIVFLGHAWGAIAILSLVYLVTSVLTELISNNAAAILMVPIAAEVAQGLGADPKAFFVAVAFAGSASFLTPMGYQTNAMVYGPGRYLFRDYLAFGWPLKIVLWGLASWLIPVIWPLS